MTIYTIIFLGIISLTVLLANKKNAILSIFFSILFLGQDTNFDLLGYNLMPSRIITFVVAFRCLIRREYLELYYNTIDKIFICLILYTGFVLGFRENNYVSGLALIFDSLTFYIAFKSIISKNVELEVLIKDFTVILTIFTIVVTVEYALRYNLFKLLNGVDYLWLRGDKVRCWGSFRHPVLLGSVGATFLPLYIGFIVKDGYKTKWLVGAFASFLIVYYSSSSTPLIAFAFGILAWPIWFIRRSRRTIYSVLITIFIVLVIIMEAPIWFILGKISKITGGTGYHRSYLIDSALRDINKWWFMGIDIKETAGWMPYVLEITGGVDITNLYIWYGVTAGIIPILLLVYLLGKILNTCFVLSINSGYERSYKITIWSLGVVIFVHSLNWFSITYFDQFNQIWLAHLAFVNIVIQKKSINNL